MKETWKEIVGFEGLYEISNLGRVNKLESISGINGAKYSSPERIINPHVGTRGYLAVNLRKDGKQCKKRIHQLLAIVFLNHVPNGFTMVVDHIDNNPLNNDLSNLQVITHRENISKDKTGGSSEYSGVQKTINKKWSANISFDGKNYFLGLFKNEIDAAKSYTKSLEDYNNGIFDPKKYNEFKPSSIYKGVAWHKGNKMWQSQIRINGKLTHIGYSKCELTAFHKIITYKKENPEAI